MVLLSCLRSSRSSELPVVNILPCLDYAINNANGIMMPGPIALKLRVLREQRGLTHKEAAELTNVSHWTLIYLENGKRAPYIPTVTKIARAYGVPVEELVEE